ncbi:MAG: TetR/AcrR family transcriptional regulator [Thermoleophilaceae bacterium]
MPRKAKLRPDEPGREKILDAARAEFGRRGYDATSIAEIGRAAGISKSVLYHYFGSKAGLYEALLEHDAHALVDAVSAAVPSPEVDGPRLRPGLDAFLGFLEEHADSWRLLTRDAPADAALREVQARVDRSVADALRYLLATREKLETHSSLVDLIAVAVRSYAAWWQSHPEVAREDVVGAIAAFAAVAAREIGAKNGASSRPPRP